MPPSVEARRMPRRTPDGDVGARVPDAGNPSTPGPNGAMAPGPTAPKDASTGRGCRDEEPSCGRPTKREVKIGGAFRHDAAELEPRDAV
eukprot:scaffold52186_cov29-Tisochrysis_lutea.AAC.12